MTRYEPDTKIHARPKRKDARGNELDYERGQIHRQLEIVPPDINGSGRQPRNAPTFREQLHRLVTTLNAQGKLDAVLSVARDREQELRKFCRTEPLSYCGHRVVFVEQEQPRRGRGA